MDKKFNLFLVAIFITLRFMLMMSLPLDGILGYGDFRHFIGLAKLPGFPMLDYWIEFPPIFPVLSKLSLDIAGGTEHVYIYLWFVILTLADSLNLWIFSKIDRLIHGDENHIYRTLAYTALLSVLAYSWWYFDSLAVLALLAGLYFTYRRKAALTGFILGLGVLVKLFPGLILALLWKFFRPKQYLTACLICVGMVSVVYGIFWWVSPRFTQASIISQASKGSWETVWALLDGNYGTGNFGPWEERLFPETAYLLRGAAAKIPAWFVWAAGAGVGWMILKRVKVIQERQLLALVGLMFSVFFLASPGWSPQWVLYFLPVLLLSLPLRRAGLSALLLILINLAEWPVLLSRGQFQLLLLTVTLRTALLLILGIEFYQAVFPHDSQVVSKHV